MGGSRIGEVRCDCGGDGGEWGCGAGGEGRSSHGHEDVEEFGGYWEGGAEFGEFFRECQDFGCAL